MLKSLKKLLITSASAFMLLMPLAAPAVVHAADIQSNLCTGTNLSVTDSTCPGSEADTKVNNLITQIINIFSIVVGVIAVIFIIVGGFRYITSGGDSASVTTARNTILYAIVGLVIVALAQVLVRFVLNRVTQQ